jgi:hypothetical protein
MTKSTLRTLSLGASVRSTTVALMACKRGLLKPNTVAEAPSAAAVTAVYFHWHICPAALALPSESCRSKSIGQWRGRMEGNDSVKEV